MLSRSVKDDTPLGFTLSRVLRNDSHQISRVAWSPDGRMLASTSGDFIHLWNVDAGKLLYTLKGGFNYNIAWSPDGKLLVSAGGDNTVQVWDAHTGKTSLIYEGHNNKVQTYV